MPLLNRTRRAIEAACTLALLACMAPSQAIAADGPGIDALDRFRRGKDNKPAVENRFFLKESRFEVAPLFGYVPNNPFARRYVGGALLSYHFSEQFAVESQITYSPDLGEADLKGLTKVLIDRAQNASATDNASFQQPLDKITLSAAFGVAWSPLYGKINLVGETVLNFDVYGFAGAAMLSKNNFVAKWDENGNEETGDIVKLEPGQNEVKVAPVLGFGTNFFITQTVALKLDARFSLYMDQKPQYDPNEQVTEQRLYNNFIASVGLSFFIPRMKPRLYAF